MESKHVYFTLSYYRLQLHGRRFKKRYSSLDGYLWFGQPLARHITKAIILSN